MLLPSSTAVFAVVGLRLVPAGVVRFAAGWRVVVDFGLLVLLAVFLIVDRIGPAVARSAVQLVALVVARVVVDTVARIVVRSNVVHNVAHGDGRTFGQTVLVARFAARVVRVGSYRGQVQVPASDHQA